MLGKQTIQPFQALEAAGPVSAPKSANTRQTALILCALQTEDGMAEWESNWNRDVLERIIALLFALAGLADLAADLPFLRRRQVLGILSHGEAEARAFVMDMAAGTPSCSEAPGKTGDAAHLATRLRMLALVLCAMLAHVARVALPDASGPRACRRSHKVPGPAVHRLEAPPAADTS
jgi:hypothetical protein